MRDHPAAGGRGPAQGRWLLTAGTASRSRAGQASPWSRSAWVDGGLPGASRPNGTRADRRRCRPPRIRWLATRPCSWRCWACLALGLAFRARWPVLDWLIAFAEAATVGAVADWFAVVALFRRPLGLPIPHTAWSTPAQQGPDRRRARPLHRAGRISLTPENVAAKLAEMDPVGRGARWLSLPANRGRVARPGCARPCRPCSTRWTMPRSSG